MRKTGFYFKLALTGIAKNRRLYIPFMLASVGVAAMFYIVACLEDSPVIIGAKGGRTMSAAMSLGKWVIGIFSVLFLCYANSFLIRRRRKEFGLYNMLGMDKRGVGRVMLSETAVAYLITAAGGLLLGIAVSKLAEMVYLRMTGNEANLSAFFVSTRAIRVMLPLYAAIFAFVLLWSLIGLRRAGAAELFKSENFGEKPPRANWLFGTVGFLLLAGGYVLAVRITNPVKALLWFFAAVILVILGTYLIFIAGSVLVCRVLQKNRRYYYDKKHFVPTAQMAYRMKRNGAGLASICILSTMTLTTLCTTATLYFGSEDMLARRFPRDYLFTVWYDTFEDLEADDKNDMIEILDGHFMKDAPSERDVSCRLAKLTAEINDGVCLIDTSSDEEIDLETYDCLYEVYWIPAEDYNRCAEEPVALADDEAAIFVTHGTYDGDELIFGKNRYRVAKRLPVFRLPVSLAEVMLPNLCVVVNDVERATEDYADAVSPGEYRYLRWMWTRGFDLPCGSEKQIELYDRYRSEGLSYRVWGYPEEELRTDEGDEQLEKSNGRRSIVLESRAEQKGYYYGMYGGVFFLGILLSAVFLCAATLIVYYKQVSEGFEDQSRFDVMQKVGMTKKQIKKSVNSQIVTVFFAPFALALLHLCFAFPMLKRIMLLVQIDDLALMLRSTAVAAVLFALFYFLVYRLTARTYVKIVASGQEE